VHTLQTKTKGVAGRVWTKQGGRFSCSEWENFDDCARASERYDIAPQLIEKALSAPTNLIAVNSARQVQVRRCLQTAYHIDVHTFEQDHLRNTENTAHLQRLTREEVCTKYSRPENAAELHDEAA
jgi:hypothetical protein